MKFFRPAAWTTRAIIVIAALALAQTVFAAFDGGGYVQVAPAFNGADGNTSYIRLSNDGVSATTFSVRVVGTPSGNIYGNGSIQVAPAASPQYALSQILSTASAGALNSGDTGYSVYLQNTSTSAFYQHVIYNGSNGFFENMSTCKVTSSGNYTGLNSRLNNVHTTRLSSYPAYVAIHNYAATSITYNAAVYDASSGSLIGTVSVPVGANATHFQPFSWYEQQLGWSPTSSQLHVNIVFTAAGSATYQAEVSNYIYNSQFSAYVNMTQRCPTAASATTTTPTTPTTPAASTCPSSSFLTVTRHARNTAYTAPSLSVTCTSTQVTVASNGIPNFEFVQTTPNALQVVNATYRFPVTPTVATGTNQTAPLVGASAVTVGGLPIFGPTESPQDGSRDPVREQILDFCGGHTAQRGDYHHHYRPDCLFSSIQQAGLVVGYAFDGYPILAPYECTDAACTTVYKVKSSYQYIGGGTAAWSTNAYVAGSGNLDKCNGMTRPNGSYAYYATDEFPYFVACYHGVPEMSNFNPNNTTYATIITR